MMPVADTKADSRDGESQSLLATDADDPNDGGPQLRSSRRLLWVVAVISAGALLTCGAVAGVAALSTRRSASTTLLIDEREVVDLYSSTPCLKRPGHRFVSRHTALLREFYLTPDRFDLKYDYTYPDEDDHAYYCQKSCGKLVRHYVPWGYDKLALRTPGFKRLEGWLVAYYGPTSHPEVRNIVNTGLQTDTCGAGLYLTPEPYCAMISSDQPWVTSAYSCPIFMCRVRPGAFSNHTHQLGTSSYKDVWFVPHDSDVVCTALLFSRGRK
jgi:hypothetical protein